MGRWINLATPTGVIEALVFYAGPTGAAVSLKLPLETVARKIANACGPAGSNAAYLYQTVTKLEEHGIRDRNLWRLQKLVADEIMRLHKRHRTMGQSEKSRVVGQK